MSAYQLAALDASNPAHYLAAVGLLRVAPGPAELSFTDTTPVLHCEDAPADLAVVVAKSTAEATKPEGFPIPAHVQTTVPAWSVVRELADRSWEDPELDAALRVFDYGRINGKVSEDPQVSPASTVLVTGRSYARKSLADLWPTPTGRKADTIEQIRLDQTEDLARDLEVLLTGGYPRPRKSGIALRFTTAETTPRLRYGTEDVITVPTVELLAYLGVTTFLAGQLGIDRDGRRGPGLTWALNPVPLGLASLVAVHEQQSAPPSWARYTTVKTSVGGGAKISHFADTRPLEPRR
ncbi:hypothetical protein SAMN05421595_0118 [Austwickia chelonae]|uniref:CRISPR-associated protein n=1 Tax=Austwickia chelonae NBRC 105200 TaxID=1184607 RepID=K6WAN6_9MICO|nr:hypothetical protein [Austwickia chelonae]GAB78907.1 hypothetical protein AUCHE_17_01190 [Austwickia chelonae NBRC 105200]SEV86286.1 hypothetical protein SAMN05421595_0118 [Austwickia chelonae]